MSETIGSLYFIEAEGTGLAKIGFSVDVRSRLHTMQSASPVKLVLLGAVGSTAGAEKALHAAHKAQRIRGEWYPLEYAMGIYDDLGEICEDDRPHDLAVIVTEAHTPLPA